MWSFQLANLGYIGGVCDEPDTEHLDPKQQLETVSGTGCFVPALSISYDSD